MRIALTIAAFVLAPIVSLGQTGPDAFDILPGWSASWNGGYTYEPEGQAGPVLGKPMSGIEVRRTTMTYNDGTKVDHVERGWFYRDAQGRMRIEGGDTQGLLGSSAAPGHPTLILLFDPASGEITALHPQTKTYSSEGQTNGSAYIAVVSSGSVVAMAEDGSQASSRPSGPKPVKEDLPPAVIGGIKVRGSRITSTIPAGAFGNERELKVTYERWFSDDLKVLVKSSNSDPRFGVTTYELTNIKQAPPDPALFQIPPSYVWKK